MSASKGQVQFVADDGIVYVTSTVYMKSLLEDKMPAGFILLSKFPQRVSPTRYKESPVYDPSGTYKKVEDAKDTNNDAFSQNAREDNKQEQVYNQEVRDF